VVETATEAYVAKRFPKVKFRPVAKDSEDD
jgi:hypothetical protein